MQRLTSYWFVFLLSLALIACGGSGKTSLDPQNPLTEQGDFKAISGKSSYKKALIQAALRQIDGLDLVPQYDVTTYRLDYLSRDSDHELVTVSGLIAVPNKNTPSPLLSFQHGTTFVDAEAPSYHLAVDTRHPEILFAALGYVVFSPDYIGYGRSKDETHPYLQRQPSADIVIDMLAAGKAWLDRENITTTPQIFLTGYSEGGYVTMAALEALQKKTGSANFTVTGAVLGAGPYDLYEALNTLLHRLSNLPEFLGDAAQEILEYFILPKNAEIYFERTFLDRYFDKNKQDNVHNWKPAIPLKLFHGKEDDIVPIESAISAWKTMVSLGADVELVQCAASSANHSRCVIPYLNYTINYFAGLRQDL